MTKNCKSLIGVFNPLGALPCFATPIFNDELGNYVQEIGMDGKVAEFTPVNIPEKSLLDIDPSLSSQVGDYALYGFYFSEHDYIAVTKTEMKNRLLDYQFKLEEKPFLLMEVAEFLNEPTVWLSASQGAFDLMEQHNHDAAVEWYKRLKVTVISKVMDKKSRISISELIKLLKKTESQASADLYSNSPSSLKVREFSTGAFVSGLGSLKSLSEAEGLGVIVRKVATGLKGKRKKTVFGDLLEHIEVEHNKLKKAVDAMRHIEHRATGRVKWFNESKGFGFIEQEAGEDIFVHYSEIESDGIKTLKEGQTVEFDLEEDEKGKKAIHVTQYR